MKKSELDEINCLRRSEGLPPIEPATVSCLRCDAKFESWDKRNNRICDECKSDEEYGQHAESYLIVEYEIERANMPETITEELEMLLHSGTTQIIYPDDLLDTTLMDREDL